MGWIKLDRSLMDNDLWNEKPFSRGQAWVDLLLMANYEEHDFINGNEVMHVRAGELVTSIQKLAERWGWSRHKVADFLDVLEAGHMAEQKRTSKNTTIFIVKWAFFQCDEEGEGHQKDIKRTSKGHQKDTYKNIKKNKKIISISDNQRDYDFEELERTLGGKK